MIIHISLRMSANDVKRRLKDAREAITDKDMPAAIKQCRVNNIKYSDVGLLIHFIDGFRKSSNWTKTIIWPTC